MKKGRESSSSSSSESESESSSSSSSNSKGRYKRKIEKKSREKVRRDTREDKDKEKEKVDLSLSKAKEAAADKEKNEKNEPEIEMVPLSTYLSIKGLTRNVSEEHLKEILSLYGEIKKIKYNKDLNGKFPKTSKSQAFVEYEKIESFDTAQRCLNGGQLDSWIITAEVLNISEKELEEKIEEFEKSSTFVPGKNFTGGFQRRRYSPQSGAHYTKGAQSGSTHDNQSRGYGGTREGNFGHETTYKSHHSTHQEHGHDYKSRDSKGNRGDRSERVDRGDRGDKSDKHHRNVRNDSQNRSRHDRHRHNRSRSRSASRHRHR